MRTFKDEQKHLIAELQKLMDTYEELTYKISPKHWRTTGTHFSELRKMKEEILEMTKITTKEKENPFVKEQLKIFVKNSKGELKIAKILLNNEIIFEEQKKFDNCKRKNHLPFDFYLPDFNICIEFDGIHHFQPKDVWGGLENFEKIKERDSIKNDFCLKNKIFLLITFFATRAP